MSYEFHVEYLEHDAELRPTKVKIFETGKKPRIVKGTPEEIRKAVKVCTNRSLHVN